MAKRKEKFKTAEAQYDDADVFVSDDQARLELSIAPMTLWRWDRSKKMAQLGWPPQIKFADGQYTRGYRSRRLLEIFKRNMIKLAIEKRNKLLSEEAA
jgi:GH43 family beta-xylosidase